TGVASRYVGRYIGVILILLGLFPPQRRHLGHQRLRHRRAAGFVLRQALVAPAVGAILIIEHRHCASKSFTSDTRMLLSMSHSNDGNYRSIRDAA
ncbi:hypothetical protein, partial [Klebsiella pneumoniae]|uniref:hypothetical protein n=1 Tax=Klebsiella pneumoniae TaxID=573 RepID=UPI003F78F159